MAFEVGSRIAALERRVERLTRASRLASASIEGTALQVNDESGSLRAILGVQSDGTTAANIVNGPPPPQPSDPVVASVLGGIIVTWDGALAGGAVLPLDWQRIEVHASIVSGFTPVTATLATTIETPQGATVVVSCDTPIYVRILARNTSGAASDPSTQVGPFGPTPVVADDILDGIVTTVKLADDAVTQAKVAVGAIGTTEISDSAITTPKIVAGAIQTAQLDTAAVNASKIAAGAVTTAKLDALAVTSNELAANSVIAGKIAAGAVTATSLTVGIAQSIAEKLNDAMADSSLWTQVSGTGTATWLTGVTDAAAGGTVMQANAYCTMERQVNIPYDPDTLYRVTVRLRVTTAPTTAGTISLGLSGVAADGTTRVNTTGVNTTSSQHFVAASGVTVAAGTAWTTYTGYIKGTAATGTGTAAADPKAPGFAHTNVRYVRPLIRLLLNSTDGVAQVDQVTVETVPTGVVNNVNIADGAITAVKISAGAVDATALSATAITGKTITGGTVNGALIQTAATGERITLNESGANKVLVYNSSGTAIGELSATGLLVKGTNGAVLWLDPNNAFPNLRLTSADGTKSAIINVSGTNARLGMNSGLFTGSGFTDMKWRNFIGDDFATIERVRDSDTTLPYGGRLDLRSDQAVLAYINSADTTQNNQLFLLAGYAQIANGRLEVLPPVSASTALYVNAPTGYTGYLERLRLNAVDKFTVDPSGNTVVAGDLTVSGVGQRTTKRRTTDATPRASTTTPTADSQLTFTGDANAVYTVEGFLKYSGPGDFQMGWSLPSGALGEWQGIGNGTTVISSTAAHAIQEDVVTSWGYTLRTETTDIASTRTYGGISSTAFGVQIRGTIRMGATAGTIALTWAQGTSNGTGTILYTDSYLRLEKVA